MSRLYEILFKVYSVAMNHSIDPFLLKLLNRLIYMVNERENESWRIEMGKAIQFF